MVDRLLIELIIQCGGLGKLDIVLQHNGVFDCTAEMQATVLG